MLCPPAPRALRYHPTGRYRLRPDGDRVVLQLHEQTRPMQMPVERWRDVTPQEVMDLVGLHLSGATINAGRSA